MKSNAGEMAGEKAIQDLSVSEIASGAGPDVGSECKPAQAS